VEGLRRSTPLFGPLPRSGIWTAVGLTGRQFMGILAVAIALFVFVGGPLWMHLRDSHFWRIAVSYLVIPPAAAVALYRNGAARPVRILEASALLVVVKLLVTAALLIVIALA